MPTTTKKPVEVTKKYPSLLNVSQILEKYIELFKEFSISNRCTLKITRDGNDINGLNHIGRGTGTIRVQYIEKAPPMTATPATATTTAGLINTHYLPAVRRDIDHPLVQFQLQEMVNCCGFVVFTAMHVLEPYLTPAKKQKLMALAHMLAEDIAKCGGYSMIVCTDVEANHKKALTSAKWKVICTVKNKRTQRNIYMATKRLVYKKP